MIRHSCCHSPVLMLTNDALSTKSWFRQSALSVPLLTRCKNDYTARGRRSLRHICQNAQLAALCYNLLWAGRHPAVLSDPTEPEENPLNQTRLLLATWMLPVGDVTERFISVFVFLMSQVTTANIICFLCSPSFSHIQCFLINDQALICV